MRNWRSWVMLTKSDSWRIFFLLLRFSHACIPNTPTSAFPSPWTTSHSKWNQMLSRAMQTRVMPTTSMRASSSISSLFQRMLAQKTSGLMPTKTWRHGWGSRIKNFCGWWLVIFFIIDIKIASVSGNTPPGDANPLRVQQREEKFPPPLCQTRVNEQACLCRHCRSNLTNA